ncbi:MAG: hypothetical protein JXD23_17800 [Spirochaetales bacterium]|nr:hypothetical protein [Spirochaetales bacterium]
MKRPGGGNLRSILCIALYFPIAASLFAADPASLAKTAFAPSDLQRTLLTVRERGYYSLRTTSKTGTALELVDRMAGVIGARSGAPGERDGRIDLLLDPGEYRVNLFPDRDAKAPAGLAVLPFTEANAAATIADYPFLYDGDFVETTLGDLATRSYWIYLPRRDELRLEVMGRALQSCALWQNGQWLTAVRPDYEEREPEQGRPALFAEFHSTLEAGHYLLVCAGGKPRAWTDESGETKLLLRRGARFLGSNGAQKLRISPFGRDAYLIAGSADYVECVRDALEQTRIGAGYYGKDRSRYRLQSSAEITKKSKEPWCSFYSRSSSERKWLVVEAGPGDLLEVSFFKRGAGSLPYDRKAKKTFWVSTVSGHAARDLIDLTPLIYTSSNRKVSFLKEGAIRVSANSPFIRKVNLLGNNSVYLFIETPGAYRVAESATAGGKARYRFTLLENRFTRGVEAEWKTPDKSVELVRGFYSLDLQPASLGILHFAVYRDGSRKPADLLKLDPPEPQSAVAWPAVEVPAKTSASLTLNSRSDAAVGVDVRELPLSLEVPLSATLAPGENVTVGVRVEKNSVLSVEGEKYSLTVSGKKAENGSPLRPGTYTFTLANQAKRADLITLYAADALSLQRFPKPVLKAFEDTFPVFTEGRPYYADFERGQTRNVLLRVAVPSLYRIETTGRLSMGLSVRTPLVPSLVQAGENGEGRNALIMTYLKPGDYLVAVSARGQSRGRAGVVLRKTEFTDLGELEPDAISRRTVESDVGLRYALSAAIQGRYAITTLGLGVNFPFRLEDAEGFPIAVGNRGTDIELDRGSYVYFSFPVPYLTRRLTTFARIIRPAAEDENAKRFDLELNHRRSRVWKETPGRAPDVFAFVLPAPLSVAASLSTGMQGELKGQSLAEPVRLAGGPAQSFDLPAGAYELAVSPQEERNLFQYTVGVSTAMLASGLVYELGYGAGSFVVSTGGDGVYDFSSSGEGDFKASLWDETGDHLIAENDDAENDWNFRITQRLGAGRYLLRIEPAGSVTGGSTVAMAVNAEHPLGERKLPFTVDQSLGREILKIPVRPDAEGVLSVRAEKGRAVKFGLYRETELLAAGEGFLAVPLYKGRAYTLQIRQSEDRPQPVKATVAYTVPRSVELSDSPRAFDCPEFLALDNRHGLSYRIADKADRVLYSTGPESPCLSPGAWIATGPGGRGYLVSAAGGTVPGVRFEPASIAAGESRTVFVGSIPHSFLADPGRSDAFLLTAETEDKPCGLSLAPRGRYKKDKYDFRGMDESDNKTFVLFPPSGAYQARLWNPEPVAAGRADARVNVRLVRLPADSGRLGKGETRTWLLDPGRALRLDLDAGAQVLRVLLSRGCAAAVWRSGEPLTMAAADAANRDVTFAVTGGTLVIANYGAADAAVKAIVSNSSDAPSPILDAAGIETVFPGEGRLTVSIPAGHEKESLCLAGDGFGARLLGRDGRISRPVRKEGPADVAVLPAEPGDLEITHGKGWISVFFSRAGQEAEDLAGRSRGLKAKPISGTERLSGGEALYSFRMDADAFAVITTTSPGVIALSGGSANGRVLAVRSGLEAPRSPIVQRLAKGDYEIHVRPIKDSSLRGTLSLARVRPVALSGKNDEKDFFIGKGEAQVFAFEVTEPGGVGVGLSAEADRLRAELYDAGSRLLGAGTLLFRTLARGTYYLAVYGDDPASGGDGLPVRYRPLVYGQDGSGAGVPQDIVNQYTNQGQTEYPEEGE